MTLRRHQLAALAAVTLALTAARVAPAAPTKPAPAPAPAPTAAPRTAADGSTDGATYLQAMEREGLLSRESGTPARLRAALAVAEKELAAERYTKAAAMLYSLVESPAYTDFSDSEEYQNAEYDLGVALMRNHAYAAAIPIFVRILARGTEALYFRSAVRRLSDIALETRDEKLVLGHLDKLTGDLPEEVVAERNYLRGRSATDDGDLEAAETVLSQVGKRSRFYAASLYLRGVAQARRGQFKAASKAFCEIVDTPDKNTFTFYVDDRYFKVKDLARLALGRLAHEESRYDDAYYHYFQIPDDSQRLPEALFEAAWSMYARGEDETARDLLDELVKQFPNSPIMPDASLLRAHADLRSCAFDDAQTGFDSVVATFEPLRDQADEMLRDPKRARAFLDKILEREATGEIGFTAKAKGTLEDRLLGFVRIDPRFTRLHEVIRGLTQEVADADRVAAEWQELSARLGAGRDGVARLKTGDDPTAPARAVIEEAAALEKMASDLKKNIEKAAREKGIGAMADLEGERVKVDELLARARDLRDGAKLALEAAEKEAEQTAAAEGPGLAKLAAIDAERARTAPARARAALEKATVAAARLGMQGIRKLDDDLTRTVELARLGKIDAVIGQKRKLEIEIEDLTAGRFPPEMLGRLYASGAVGDDEIYWPFDGTFWRDEYEGFR